MTLSISKFRVNNLPLYAKKVKYFLCNKTSVGLTLPFIYTLCYGLQLDNLHYYDPFRDIYKGQFLYIICQLD
jgi:hypothetical protein